MKYVSDENLNYFAAKIKAWTKNRNPMTSAGDLIVGGANGEPTRLPLGTAGQVPKVNAAGTGLEYGDAGGGGGYAHCLTTGTYGGFVIVNNTPEAFTTTTLRNWLYNNGFVDASHSLPINVYVFYNANYYNVLWYNGTALRSFETNLATNVQSVANFPFEFTDMVVQIS